MHPRSAVEEAWPHLRLDDWKDTRQTLHMWTQVVGKIRMSKSDMLNHWWHSTLYVNPRGLTTGPVPHGTGVFEVMFDFVSHELRLEDSLGSRRAFDLVPMPVATFYRKVVANLLELGVPVRIHPVPNEVDPAIPFLEDVEHRAYDPGAAATYFRQLLVSHDVMSHFRAQFMGKVSPVHFFWGAMDLACTRFSGRLAPPYVGSAPNCPSWVMEEGYSRELSSCGFWPGYGSEGAYYSYAYPDPEGFSTAPVSPRRARWSDTHREFLLPYEDVRRSPDPRRTLLAFLRTTYEAAADLGGWDRALLEGDPHRLVAKQASGAHTALADRRWPAPRT